MILHAIPKKTPSLGWPRHIILYLSPTLILPRPLRPRLILPPHLLHRNHTPSLPHRPCAPPPTLPRRLTLTLPLQTTHTPKLSLLLTGLHARPRHICIRLPSLSHEMCTIRIITARDGSGRAIAGHVAAVRVPALGRRGSV